MHFQFRCIIRTTATRPLFLVKIVRIIFEFLQHTKMNLRTVK